MVLKFQNFHKTDIPYITINVQDKPLNMIVDTGCGLSLIHKKVVDTLKVEKSPRKISISALTDDSLSPEVVVIPITIDDTEVKEDFGIYNGPEDMANFQSLYGITIHGILGTEFFEKTNCRIDYKKHCLIIP